MKCGRGVQNNINILTKLQTEILSCSSYHFTNTYIAECPNTRRLTHFDNGVEKLYENETAWAVLQGFIQAIFFNGHFF